MHRAIHTAVVSPHVTAAQRSTSSCRALLSPSPRDRELVCAVHARGPRHKQTQAWAARGEAEWAARRARPCDALTPRFTMRAVERRGGCSRSRRASASPTEVAVASLSASTHRQRRVGQGEPRHAAKRQRFGEVRRHQQEMHARRTGALSAAAHSSVPHKRPWLRRSRAHARAAHPRPSHPSIHLSFPSAKRRWCSHAF